LAAPAESEVEEPGAQHAISAELDETIPAAEVEPNDKMTARGYDEAVENGTPFSADSDHLAQQSPEPVALTEADPITPDELALQETGRDLRPDVITPVPDITSAALADLEEVLREETAGATEDVEVSDLQTEAQMKPVLEPSSDNKAATSENAEKQTDASDDAAK